MFISFEGIDGSGKSTQAHLLTQSLRALGYAVLLVREPGGTDLGEHIRSWLLDPAQHVSSRAEALLFSAARAQLIEVSIKPALAAGTTVIADRFYDSTTAYQGGGRGVADFDQLESLHRLSTDAIHPDLTIVVDVDVETAVARRLSDLNDRIEAEDISFHDRVRQAYLTLAALHPQRLVVVDGAKDARVLHREIAITVAERLG